MKKQTEEKANESAKQRDVELAERLLLLRVRRAEAEEQLEALKSKIHDLDEELDGMLKSVVACV